jgi:glycosyltransferase domain-containing protein
MSNLPVAPRTTVLLTTSGRPDELARLLTFWKEADLRRRVIVLDSSPPDIKARNRKTCSLFQFPDPIVYREFAESVFPFEKWHRTMPEITTPYVIFAAEDDFLIPSALTDCEDFLDQNEDYAVCHGIYLSFRRLGDTVRLYEDSFATSNDAPTPEERLLKQFRHYGHFTYGLRRTSLWNNWPPSIQVASDSIPVEAGGLQEMSDAMLCLIAGKVKTLPLLQIVRNGQPTSEDGWKKTFVFGPNFSNTIVSFKATLIEALSLSGTGNAEEYDFLLNECLKIYFSTVFSPSEKKDLPENFPVLRSSSEDRAELDALIEHGDFKLPEFKSVFGTVRKTPLEHDLAKTDLPALGSSRYQILNWLNESLESATPIPDFKYREELVKVEKRNPFMELLRQPRKSFQSALKLLGR